MILLQMTYEEIYIQQMLEKLKIKEDYKNNKAFRNMQKNNAK